MTTNRTTARPARSPNPFTFMLPLRHQIARLWKVLACAGAVSASACGTASRESLPASRGANADPDPITVIGSPGWEGALPPVRFDSTRQAVSARVQLEGALDAVADSSGRVFVLGTNTGRIAVTDRQLHLAGYIGGNGADPGKFREPVSLGILGNGRLAVLDRAQQRVTVLAVARSGDSAAVERIVPLRSESESMCILPQGLILIYGLRDGQRLHVFDLGGNLLRSFAPADTSHSFMAQKLLAMGRIACDPAHDEVIITSVHTPAVEAYRVSTGERLWTDVLRPFRPLNLIDRRHSVTLESDHAGYSRISGAFALNDLWVFQTRYDSRLDEATRDTVVTYVYSRATHNWLNPELGLPLVFPVGAGDALSATGEHGTGTLAVHQLLIEQTAHF